MARLSCGSAPTMRLRWRRTWRRVGACETEANYGSGNHMIPGHPYAGFWRRAGGYLLDYVLVLLPSMVISFIVTRVFAGVAPKLVSTLIFWPLMLAYFVIGNGSGA